MNRRIVLSLALGMVLSLGAVVPTFAYSPCPIDPRTGQMYVPPGDYSPYPGQCAPAGTPVGNCHNGPVYDYLLGRYVYPPCVW